MDNNNNNYNGPDFSYGAPGNNGVQNSQGQNYGAQNGQGQNYGAQNGQGQYYGGSYGQAPHGQSPYGQPPYGQSPYGQQGANFNQPPKKKSKKKLGLIIGGAVAAVAAVAVLGAVFLPKLFVGDKGKVFSALSRVGTSVVGENPASVFSQINSPKMQKAFLKDSMSFSMSLNLEDYPSGIMDDSMLSLSGFQLDVDMDRDMKKKQLSGSMSMGYAGTELISAGIYGSEEDFCFFLPQLFDGHVRIPAEDFAEAYNQSVFGQQSPLPEDDDISLNLFGDAADGADVFDFTTTLAADAAKMYENITVEKLPEKKEFTMDGKTVKATGYELVIPQKDYLALIQDVLDIAYDNEGLLAQDSSSREELNEIRNMIDQLFTNDIIVTVYMSGSKVAAIEAATTLNADSSVPVTFNSSVYFDNAKAYGQAYNGNITFSNGSDEIKADFVKTTETSKNRADSEFDLEFGLEGEALNYSFDASYDKDSGKFTYDLGFFDEYIGAIDFGLYGTVDDMKEDTSYELSIDKLFMRADDEQLSFSGSVAAGPLEGDVELPEEPEYDIFFMSENELTQWMGEIQENVMNWMMSLYGM